MTELSPELLNDLYELQKKAPQPKAVPSAIIITDKPPHFGIEYHGNLRQSDTATYLTDEGCFLIRRSPGNTEGTYTLSFKVNGTVHHYHLHFDGSSYYIETGAKFKTLNQLVYQGLLTKFLDFHGTALVNKNNSMHYSKQTRVSIRSKRPLSKDFTNKPHNFRSLSLKALSSCAYCGNFLWGFPRVFGNKCKDCGIQVHYKCCNKIAANCNPKVRSFFGKDLTLMVKHLGTERPFIVDKCIEEIERRGLDVEGLYRVCGFADEVEALKNALDKDMDKANMSPQTYDSIHVITGVLKLYLRLLPDPLITYESQAALLETIKLKSESEMLHVMKSALMLLPDAHWRTLKYLIEHLSRVVARSEHTKMTALNMATVINPTIMPIRDLRDIQFINSAIEILEKIIVHHEYIFS